MNSIAQRLKQAREAAGMTQPALAEKAGVSQGTIGNIESGLRKRPRELLSIAAALGVNPSWLDTGKGQMRSGVVTPDEGSHGIADASEKLPLMTDMRAGNTSRRAPVVAWARLGDDLNRDNDEWPIEAMREIHATKPASRKVKWLEVQDDLLAPKVLKGDLVAVDPLGSPKLDSLVLAMAADGSFMLRFWRPLAGGAFEVFDGAGRTMDSIRHGIQIAAVFVTLQRDNL